MDNKPKNILENIGSGQLKKKPKWQFILRNCLITLGAAILFAIAVFLISFVFELLVSANFSFFPHVAGLGFGFYLLAFPWSLLFKLVLFMTGFTVMLPNIGYR